MANQLSLLLIGCGKMGGALLSRWHEHPPAGISKFSVIDPNAPHHLSSVDYFADLASLPSDYRPDTIVFAVKPQSLEKILPDYAKRFGNHPLYISIAAGKTLSFFSTHLGEHAHIVRAMPNTPATVGQGVTVLCASKIVSASLRSIATQIMQATGHVEWLEDELLMDAVTAVSGSGPAYVFLFLEALTKAGVAQGLPEKLARQLAIKTLSGSSALAQQSTESLETLRKNVTSPGGTTEAALSVLMKEDMLEKLIGDAVKKATQRSKELSE